MSPVTSSNPGSGAASQPPAPTAASAMVDKTMFMQLLVAQLRNQDPLNPTDGTQFVTQLAQYQQLEQSVNTGQDIAAIRGDVDTFLAGNSAAGTRQS